MVEMTDDSSAGPSAMERELYAHFVNHVETERSVLEQYVSVAEQSESKAFRYLVNLLIEDERRHHRLFMEIADSIKTEALTGEEDAKVPGVDFYRADRTKTLESTMVLLKNEQDDEVELKRLKRLLKDVKDVTLWSLLVELMQLDTKKHIAILRFVRKHTRTPY
jgi:rubrerythrin